MPPTCSFCDRTGSIPGARLTLRVSDDGLVRCNGGERRRMPDELLLDAREIARELERPAQDDRTLPPGARSVLRYRLGLEEGTVRFSDSSRGQTREMFLTQEFARQVASRSAACLADDVVEDGLHGVPLASQE